jgi:ribulose 1,5-bisphosphate synthetase/thiazole synthase
MRFPVGLALVLALAPTVPAAITEVDVCVFGATSAGIIAAVQTAAMGESVALLEPGRMSAA